MTWVLLCSHALPKGVFVARDRGDVKDRGAPGRTRREREGAYTSVVNKSETSEPQFPSL